MDIYCAIDFCCLFNRLLCRIMLYYHYHTISNYTYLDLLKRRADRKFHEAM